MRLGAGISASGAMLQGFGTEQVDRLVTLGSPHQAPPKVCGAYCRHHILQYFGHAIGFGYHTSMFSTAGEMDPHLPPLILSISCRT